MRCFLAIEMSPEAREHLRRVQERLRREVPSGNFPRHETLHVTLKFLGEVSDQQLARLCESLEHVRLSARVQWTAAQLDFFPARGIARVMVATMRGSEPLVQALHRGIEQRCQKLGFDAEQREYRPHATLARIKSGLDSAGQARTRAAAENHFPGPTFHAEEFALFESRLGPQGSQYTKLATFGFAAEQARAKNPEKY